MRDHLQDTLSLPLPRWPFLWPALGLLAPLLNGLNGLVHFWPGSPWSRVLGVLLLLGYGLSGVSLALCLLASRWRELRLEGDQLVLRPWWGGFASGWALAWYSLPLARRREDGLIRIPISSATLEWVGRTLLLHALPDLGVNLGRGPGAESIAQWLKAHGWADPVGRSI